MARLNINGRIRDVQVEADTPLLWVIREQVGLTGTKYGCGVAQCGACSVHINGGLARSCAIPVGSVKATDKIVTIEGLSAARSHPVQKAWAALDVPQCGYCQSGQIMAAAALRILRAGGLHLAASMLMTEPGPWSSPAARWIAALTRW